MATERTPPHKRIVRAEQAREEWKLKAVKRREENLLLKEDIKYKNMKLGQSKNEVKELKRQLMAAQKKIATQENLIEKIKKNT
jgi:chromosome segregation ATPase